MIKFGIFLIITIIVVPSLIKWSYKGDLASKVLGYSIAFFFLAVNIILGADVFFNYSVNNYIICILMICLPIMVIIGVVIKYIIGDDEDKKNVRTYFIFLFCLLGSFFLFVILMKFLKEVLY
ncbi:hypothetical protein LC087_12730 [Bacillus carboniphilus]|uniref:DUF3397 domain-containing protein n=1 Tax=Bacillus carboniphilus TaxID=86663 RepID=A0ABY9JQP3_9BACI|nr:hypothetical protein [Bacillus carboniphilus]WLR41724.1 hypothetical protein LC087_12730 [Bacillus carboniphilus]